MRVEVVAGTRITRTHHGASIPQVSAKPFNSNNKECTRRNTRGDRKGGGGGWSRGTSTRSTVSFKFSPLFFKNKHPGKLHCTFFFFTTKVRSLISVEGGYALSRSTLNDKIPKI